MALEKRTRKQANVEATRAALLSIARKHFARDGFSKTEISRIAKDARVTTGAIYHHFAGKKALFQAVAEDLENEILSVTAEVNAPDPWERVRLSFEKLIDVCAQPSVQRIIFVEAPQVVGPEAWREIELKYAFGVLRTGLEAMRAAGLVKPYPTELIAKTLLALLRETSAEVARAKNDATTRTLISEMVRGMLDVFHA